MFALRYVSTRVSAERFQIATRHGKRRKKGGVSVGCPKFSSGNSQESRHRLRQFSIARRLEALVRHGEFYHLVPAVN
jgi:hypothetical protein